MNEEERIADRVKTIMCTIEYRPTETYMSRLGIACFKAGKKEAEEKGNK